MFIAHVPAGYLVTRYLQSRTHNYSRVVLWVGLVASIFPDVDLAWFYLVDDRKTLHHHYYTHIPLTWIILGLVSYCMLRIFNKQSYYVVLLAAFVNVMLHMVLDSVAASIRWLYPFSEYEVNLVHIPARHSWWVYNFIFHWTFVVELLIIAAAGIVWFRSRKNISP